MAHNVEPMDIDNIEGDFDNKENTFHHSNVLPRTPCTEKGYEELDVSELNMKLRYSITPASSPMSKSYTAHCLDNRNSECPDNTTNSIENANLTRSFNSMLTKNDNLSKSLKLQPLQLHMADQSLDNNRNTSVLRPLDSTIADGGNNITVTITEAHDIYENLSLPSSSSSALHTPEATTPTKDIPKHDGGSPIMRGLKSVLNMFRASQSPIPSVENEDNIVQHDISGSVDIPLPSSISSDNAQVALASTPIAARNKREPSSKRGSPHKESIVFNEDLEKELLWKDETTILFSEEKIPIHKLFFQQSKNFAPQAKELKNVSTAHAAVDSLNETVEFMDVSYNDSIANNKTITDITDVAPVAESDSEFVDCETTFTQQSDNEKNIESDKKNTATFISDVPGSNQAFAQELEISTGEKCNKKSVNTNNTVGIPVTVIQDAHEVSIKNIEEILDAIIPTNSNKNQETESKLCSENPNEPLNGSTFTMELHSGENPLMSSTFMNVTRDIIKQKEMMQPLEATLIVDKEDKSVFSSAGQNIEENTSIQDTKPLDATVSIESNDKPMSVSTFIMNSTQNITQFVPNNINDDLNTTATVEEKSMTVSLLSTEIKNMQFNATHELEDKLITSSAINVTQIVQAQLENENTIVTLKSDNGINNITQNINHQSTNEKRNNPLDITLSLLSSDETVLSSSTFVSNTMQDVEPYLASDKNDKFIDATVTVDSTEKPASSTFIKDITQDIESHMSINNLQTSLDTVELMNSVNKPISSSFVNDITQDPGIKCSDITITTKSMEIPISLTITKDLTHEIDGEVAVSQNDNILNFIKPKNEICTTTEYLDETLLSDKSVILSDDSKCITQQILDPQVVSDYIESVSDVSLSTRALELPKKCDGDFSIHVNLDLDTQPPSNICKPADVTLPVTATETEISAIQEVKQIVNDEVIPKEIIFEHYSSSEIQSINPDILSSGDVTKFIMDKIDGNVLDSDISVKVIETLEQKKFGEILPVNIPLPYEDDMDFESLSTVQPSIKVNAANSSGLPDVINDLNSMKTQGVNQIDEVSITAKDHVKAPAEVINYTLNKKVDELYCNSKTVTENSNANSLETKNSEQAEKSIVLESNFNSDQSIDHHIKKECEGNISSNLKALESKSEEQPESMDISSTNHDISSHKDSVLEVNQNITKIDLDPIYLNLTKENKETTNIEMSSSVIANLPEMLASPQNVSIDNLKIKTPSDTSANTENERISESLQLMPKSDEESKKDTIQEEIIVCENNSPYVLVSVDKDGDIKNDSSLEEDFEKIENPFANKSKILASPPTSPPIASKGYNFNFDEIDDPFATKTKIRTSPSLDSPKQINRSEEKIEVPRKDPVNKNKRKSYPVRPKSAITKKNINSSFDGSLSTQCVTVKDKSDLSNKKHYLDDKHVPNLNKPQILKDNSNVSRDNVDTELNVIEKSDLEHNIDNTSKSIVNSKIQSKETNFGNKPPASTPSKVTNVENKSPIASTTPSSSEQSIYLSAATSSGESVTAKNVFNIPEIDDINFNPFASKSKIRLSPPLSLEMGEAIITETKFDSQSTTENANVSHAVHILHNVSQENKLGYDEKNCSDASHTTCSSKDDKNATVREVHTDDDDTIEGPFLEAEDNDIKEFALQNEKKNTELAGLNLQNDMMEFSDLPAQDNEDNELFIDAASYEFLLNQNKSNVVMDSGKESLFLKFDPLFAKRLSSEGIAAVLSNIQKKQSTPKKMTKLPAVASTEQAIAGPSTSNIFPQQLDTTEDIAEDLNITASKPMMVVTPAVNPIIKPRKSTTPASSNRRSITFTSPAIAVIDRLLSLSANNSFVDQNTTITHASREQDEAELALTQLRELLAEKEINVYSLRSESKELKDRLLSLESQMKVLETESEKRLKKVNELNEKLTEKTQINKSMAAVVEEYERTIASLIAETEQDRKRHDEERAKLVKERDEQTAHLASMEVSFSDLHSKYEKSKQIILSCKANEDTYKKSIKEFEENLTKMQNNYEMLKQHATSKLNHANQELEKMNKAHESEVLKLNAMIKRKELHITSLEETLTQKTKANEELTAICDELINKVG